MAASVFVQVSCTDFNATLTFFTTAPLNFQVESIFPADDPSEATLLCHGIKLLLVRDGKDDATTVCIQLCDLQEKEGADLIGPNGTLIRLLPAEASTVSRPPLRDALVVTHLEHEGEAGSTVWSVGRAGMRYRDLIPCRLGGRYIASHIHIPEGGPVPDYCHYHHVHFQMIFCYKGWVRVVYEDQGAPFVLQPGDCVLQPPGIRHRVLEASDDLQVLEVGSPAVHKTMQDFQISLPSAEVLPGREYGGQKFARDLLGERDLRAGGGFGPAASTGLWGSERGVWEEREAGILQATGGMASARVVRLRRGGQGSAGSASEAAVGEVAVTRSLSHASDLLLLFVLEGSLDFSVQQQQLDDQSEEQAGECQTHRLVAGSSIVIPAHTLFHLGPSSRDVEVLEIQVYR